MRPPFMGHKTRSPDQSTCIYVLWYWEGDSARQPCSKNTKEKKEALAQIVPYLFPCLVRCVKACGWDWERWNTYCGTANTHAPIRSYYRKCLIYPKYDRLHGWKTKWLPLQVKRGENNSSGISFAISESPLSLLEMAQLMLSVLHCIVLCCMGFFTCWVFKSNLKQHLRKDSDMLQTAVPLVSDILSCQDWFSVQLATSVSCLLQDVSLYNTSSKYPAWERSVDT